MRFNCYNDSFLAPFCLGYQPLVIASRSSTLAVAQVYECVHLLRTVYPRLWVKIHKVKTQGDYDKQTPLRCVEDSDFFTKEVDDLLKSQQCHLALHSAKDLPLYYDEQLLVAVTRSIHPADVLVYGSRFRGQHIPERLRLGCSSKRREAILRKKFPLGHILDIRGTIEERLEQLEEEKYDAIVVAKAALVRLHLHLSPVEELPPPYHPLQGCLAITAKRNLPSWRNLFLPWSCEELRKEFKK